MNPRTPNQKPSSADAEVDAILDSMDNSRHRRSLGIARFQPRLRAKGDKVPREYYVEREAKR